MMYSPEQIAEVAEIARAYSAYCKFVEIQRGQFNPRTGKMHLVLPEMDAAIQIAQKIPGNIREVLGIDKELADLEAKCRD
jgi:hypothetical protein